MSNIQPGFRIRTHFDRIAETVVTQAAAIPVAVIGDVSHRLFSLPGGFQNYSHKTFKFAGTALTVKVRPGDNLFLHKAIDVAEPGDVIVCSAGGEIQNAILGELMGRYAVSRGVAGIIIDGAVRDTAGLAKLPIPVYARAVTPNGPWKSGPGEVGFPIGVSGLSVSSGDLIVGDEDGIIALPQADAIEIIAKAQIHLGVEEQWTQQITENVWPRGWVDEIITKGGL
ncbi:RraA family protein [Escherichia coli]|uniref:RraA family protein n=1 Tax=Enterobacteriaceae TaxID=543 RepID=UPI0007E91246|nr:MULTISPECIES: RraA family protein [Enterobacteriaceae]ELT9736120.1 RraA family protein [Klebsiella michiganensis]QMN62563.1 RraA family protein [Citrobacter freundii]EEW1620304.1 RraA family protein [Escherichia coli]EEW7528201.1 RraA family protein [Escherichia coli]EEZ0424753.1 RraA family protein [Escherichia coli]